MTTVVISNAVVTPKVLLTDLNQNPERKRAAHPPRACDSSQLMTRRVPTGNGQIGTATDRGAVSPPLTAGRNCDSTRPYSECDWYSMIRLPQVSSSVAIVSFPHRAGGERNATPSFVNRWYSAAMSSTRKAVNGIPSS